MTFRFSNRALGALLLLLGLATTAAAQPRSSGSIYSRFGLGERTQFGSSSAQALGGVGTALPFFDYVSITNPATFGNLYNTRFMAGARYQSMRSTNNAGATSSLSHAALSGLSFAFPLVQGKLGMGFGTEPYTRVGYHVRTTGVLPPDEDGDVFSYETNLVGNGGLQRFALGMGYAFTEQLRAGVSLQVLHGINEFTQETGIVGQTDFIRRSITDGLRLTGVSAQAGVFYHGGYTDDETTPRYAFGATLTLPTTLKGERVRTIGLSLDRDTLSVIGSGSVRVPLEATVAASVMPSTSWLLAVEGRYEPWTQFESDYELPGYTPGGSNSLRDRWRVGGGVQYLPSDAAFNRGFFSRTAYRLGAYVDNGYIGPLTDVDVRTYALTGGVSLPTLFSTTRFDLNGEFGLRGTTDQDLVRDLFYRISLTLNFGERWFVKPKLQ